MTKLPPDQKRALGDFRCAAKKIARLLRQNPGPRIEGSSLDRGNIVLLHMEQVTRWVKEALSKSASESA